MMDAQLRLLTAAARIRVSRGERLEDVLGMWPAIDDRERELIRAAVLDEEATGAVRNER